MTAKPEFLVWPGAESMTALESALRERREVVLTLSSGLHNALVSIFTHNTAPELELNIEGGAELVDRLRNIAGLEPLSELQNTLHDGSWRVCITSPSPRITLTPLA